MMLNAIIEKDSDGYFACIPELKGCVSEDKSYEETVMNIKEAGELYLESLKKEELTNIQSKITSIVPIKLINT